VSRAYSTTSGGYKGPQAILWGVLATGGVLVAGYSYMRSKYPHVTEEPARLALNSRKFKPFTLQDKVPINHDTSMFRFALDPDEELGLYVTSCFVAKARVGDDEKPIVRAYTPVSPQYARGYFDMVVKKYDDGKMSSHIHGLEPGDVLHIKGPIHKLVYNANDFKEIGMVAGGSGITPMLQLLQHVLDDPKDKTKLTLMYANKSEDDIILRSLLDSYAEKYPKQFRVVYTVDKASTPDWKGEVGYVTKDMVQKYFPAASKDNVMMMVCGPMPMMKSVSGPKLPDFSQGEVDGIFKELGYKSDQVFKF
ncbi:hypothetical protein IW145_003915, partial [Coemansia sp. RSA 521]